MAFVSNRHSGRRRGCTISSRSLRNSSVGERLSARWKLLSHPSTNKRIRRHSPLTATYSRGLWTWRQRDLFRKKTHLERTSQQDAQIAPSDPSYMKRWHHLEWYRFRKCRSSYRRRRRDCFHSLELVLRVNPASAAFVDLLDGCLMGNPPFVEVTSRSSVPTEVVVVLATNSHHDVLEAGQLVLQILDGIMKDIQLGRLLANHLPKIMGLEKQDLVYIANWYTTKTRTLDFSCRSIHQRRSTMSRLDHLSNEATSVGCSPKAASHFWGMV